MFLTSFQYIKLQTLKSGCFTYQNEVAEYNQEATPDKQSTILKDWVISIFEELFLSFNFQFIAIFRDTGEPEQ